MEITRRKFASAHLFLRAAGLGLTDRHATVDVLDLGNRQTGFGLGRQLLLATDDVWLQATNGFGVFRLALGQCIGPAFVNFVARELAQEVGTRYVRITNTEPHDRTFQHADAQGHCEHAQPSLRIASVPA